MIRGTINYRQPKNLALEAEIEKIFSQNFSQKLGKFGFNEGTLEAMIGIKKDNSIPKLQNDLRTLSNQMSNNIVLSVARSSKI